MTGSSEEKARWRAFWDGLWSYYYAREAGDEILEILEIFGEATIDEISVHTEIPPRLCRGALARLEASGGVQRIGKGVRGDPFRYRRGR